MFVYAYCFLVTGLAFWTSKIDFGQDRCPKTSKITFRRPKLSKIVQKCPKLRWLKEWDIYVYVIRCRSVVNSIIFELKVSWYISE